MILKEGEVICDKCQGKGKLDWVTNAMGSKQKPPDPVSPSGTSGFGKPGKPGVTKGGKLYANK